MLGALFYVHIPNNHHPRRPRLHRSGVDEVREETNFVLVVFVVDGAVGGRGDCRDLSGDNQSAG